MNNKKIILLVTLLIFHIAYSQAQIIKLENGASFSWTNYSNKASLHYCGSIGVDYFEKSIFMLNSKISYFKRQELSNLEYFPESSVKNSISYIEASTTARLKQPFLKGNLFIGLGPAIDFKLSSTYDINGVPQGVFKEKGEFLSEDIIFSILSECGYFIDVKRWRFELNLSYKNNLTKIVMTRKGFISHIIAASIGVGYHL